MFFPESNTRIWLFTPPTDMRKSYDGLSALVKNKMGEDPLTGHLFVFINRKRSQCKILYFDRSGYCLWSKRLEQGQFHIHAGTDKKYPLEWTDLKLILEGIDTRSIRHYKRYRHPNGETKKN